MAGKIVRFVEKEYLKWHWHTQYAGKNHLIEAVLYISEYMYLKNVVFSLLLLSTAAVYPMIHDLFTTCKYAMHFT